MVLLTIKTSEFFHSTHNTPAEFRDWLPDHLWTKLSGLVHDSFREANCLACAIEWCICLLFLFPCIFLCHPCLAELFMSNLQSKCRQFNTVHFNGRPVVISSGRNELLVNTDLINDRYSVVVAEAFYSPIVIENMANPHQQVQVVTIENQQPTTTTATTTMSPLMVQATSLGAAGDDSSNSSSQGSYEPPQTYAPSQMSVIIPENCGPGSILEVQAPNGAQVRWCSCM
jgi:hypothetical protein